MIVLGIDPGLNRMGYGLIEVNREVPKAIDFGIIKTSPDEKRNDKNELRKNI